MRAVLLLTLVLSTASGYAADIDSGEQAYERCALCHGLFGNTPRTKFPKLAGQNPDYLEKEIRDFINGKRTNDGGQMAGVVTEIDESDIPVVVEWFSTQDNPEPSGTDDDKGAMLFVKSGCSTCHTEKNSDTDAIPKLYAQHRIYLAKQMRELRDGVRTGESDGLMQKQLLMLSNEDIEAVATHLAAQGRLE